MDFDLALLRDISTKKSEKPTVARSYFLGSLKINIKKKLYNLPEERLGNVDKKFSSRKTDLVRYGGEGVKVDPLLRDKNLLKKN